MRRSIRARLLTAVLGMSMIAGLLPGAVMAHDPANDHFQRTWERTDQPVATSEVARTWIWGPEGFTASCTEPYHTPGVGEREIQYFDKSRMEITDPAGDVNSPWFVTQGLLATEMITGQMQIGDHEHIDWHPAEVHIAGDPGGGAPSYADFGPLTDMAPLGDNAPVTQTLNPDGGVADDPALVDYGVTASEYIPDTNHRIASVFWSFMNSEGTVLEGGVSSFGQIFENPFYAVGFPLTEAYWTNIQVDGEQQDVLVQAFQRRVLTYTPGNEVGWQVEAGNVGQHYYIWRYGEIPDGAGDACPETTHVTFNVYEPRDGGAWEQIAVTTTSEVWHPEDLASGTWSTFTDTESEVLTVNSSGIMLAEHTYTSVLGNRILSGLEAEIWEINGPSGGTAHVSAGDFSLGDDPRIDGAIFTGSGNIAYETADDSGSVGFEVAGTSTTTFHVFLNGPAPPVFFR